MYLGDMWAHDSERSWDAKANPEASAHPVSVAEGKPSGGSHDGLQDCEKEALGSKTDRMILRGKTPV